VVFAALSRLLHRRIAEVQGCELLPDLTNVDGFWRTQSEEVASSEIDAEVLFAPNIKRSRAGDDQRERAHAREKTLAEEIDVLRGDQVQHRNLLYAVRVDEPAEDIAPHDERGEKRSENAD